jgi:hypothetical protein
MQLGILGTPATGRLPTNSLADVFDIACLLFVYLSR